MLLVVVLTSAFPHTAPALAARGIAQTGDPGSSPGNSPGSSPPLPTMVAPVAPAAVPETVNTAAESPAEAQTVFDTPTPIIQDGFEYWTATDGLLYWWSTSCPIGLANAPQNPQTNSGGPASPAAARPAQTDQADITYFLKRAPTSGGTIRTLSQTTQCGTFGSPMADAQGIYYFNGAGGTVEFRPSGSPFDPARVLTTTVSFPVSPFATAGDYVYWINYDTNMYRIRRDGTGQQMVVAGAVPGGGGAGSILVLGSSVYWLTDSLNVISTDCATLPCTSTRQGLTPVSGFGSSLIYVPGITVGSYSLMWAEDRPDPAADRIRRYSCNTIIATPCSVTTFYDVPNTSWTLGTTISARNQNLFWQERAADYRILRKPLFVSANAQEIVSNDPGIYPNIYTDASNVYFAKFSPSNGIYKIPLTATAITRDLAADAFEVTQAIQNLANDVPLVKDKPAYVRVYGKQLAGPNALTVDAKLFGRRNGSPLPGSPLSPVNGTKALAVGGNYNRANKNDGWLFRLPSSWLNGNVELTASVDPNQAYTDPSPGNNSLIKTFNFQSQPPLCILAVPVRTHYPNPTVNDPNFRDMVDRFKRVWPISQVNLYRTSMVVEEPQLCWYGPFPYPCGGPFELDETGLIDDRDMAMGLLMLISLGWSVSCGIGGNGEAHTMGMVSPYAPTGGVSGYANLVVNASWVQSPPHSPNPFPNTFAAMHASATMAQELAHNTGRNHVNCGNPSGIDNNYPYPPCQLDNVGPANHYGFDIASLTPIAPDRATDFMSYGGNNWVSDYTFKGLLNAFLARAQANAATAAAPGLFPVAPEAQPAASENPAKAVATTQVYGVGTIDLEKNVGNLISLRVMDDATIGAVSRAKWETLKAQAEAYKHGTPHVHSDGSVHLHSAPNASAVNYHLRLLNAASVVLTDTAVNVLPTDNHISGTTPALFTVNFPAPAGQVARAELMADNQILDVFAMGVNTPTISILQPAGGESVGNSLTVQWLGSDPDNDPVIYGVQYSHDNGATWTPIVEQYAGSPTEITKTLVISNLNSLHGSNGATARIRIIGSDGYHTAVALSNPFTFANRDPEPYIINPDTSAYVSPVEPAVLHGGAMDAEDGDLNGVSLTWRVNGNVIGTDSDQIAEGLAPGAYTVTLAAKDSASKVATATNTLRISPLGVPAGANSPALDGACEDSAYADGVRLQLKPYGDGDQATALMTRTGNDLWVCFSHLKKGNTDPGAFVGVRADVNFSRDGVAQADDLGFFVGEDGGVFTTAGDGAGGFAQSGPTGLTAQVSAMTTTWQAELRIPATLLGGFEHTIGLNLGHYRKDNANDDYLWPYASVPNGPNTWAQTTLGAQPQIDAITPFTQTAGSPAFTLTVQGSGFANGTTVLWNNAPLPTTFIDANTLSVAVSAADVAVGGVASVVARSAGAGNFVSNPASFTVLNPTPVLTSLSPNAKPAGEPSFTLTVNGTNFLNGAIVMWNGTPLATTFVSGSQLQAQVPANLIAIGQLAGISVHNPAPDNQDSDSLPFVVPPIGQLFVPVIMRQQ